MVFASNYSKIYSYDIVVKSNSKEILSVYIKFVKKLFRLESVDLSLKNLGLPTKLRRITLFKSPHVNKCAKESFEMRVYSRVYNIQSQKNIVSLLKQITLNKPSSVSLKILCLEVKG